MNDRERLVEMISNVPYGTRRISDCYFKSTIERIADFLISHGVTVHKHGRWVAIPSSDMVTGKAFECSGCKK